MNKEYLNQQRRELRHILGISKKYIRKYGGTAITQTDIAKYRKEYFKKNPWVNTLRRITTRCVYDKNSSYYKRGIKCIITIKELKILWFRDKAYNLTQPSIDRKNSNSNYTFDNCRYIELNKNKKQKKVRNRK